MLVGTFSAVVIHLVVLLGEVSFLVGTINTFLAPLEKVACELDTRQNQMNQSVGEHSRGS